MPRTSAETEQARFLFFSYWFPGVEFPMLIGLPPVTSNTPDIVAQIVHKNARPHNNPGQALAVRYPSGLLQVIAHMGAGFGIIVVVLDVIEHMGDHRPGHLTAFLHLRQFIGLREFLGKADRPRLGFVSLAAAA